MKTIGKVFGTLILFIFIFSLTVNDKPIFNYFYEIVSPLTKLSQNAAKNFLKNSVSITENYSKKLFDNSVPKIKASARSSILEDRMNKTNPPSENITDQEKSQLNELIKNY
jgi:hypothetical protein